MYQYSLKIVTGADVEPVTVEEVKLHTRIDDDDQDTLLEGWIRAARELAEDYQKRSYLNKTYDMYMDDWPGSPFAIPRYPVQSVTHVKYYDTDGTEYTFYDSGTTTNVDIDLESEPARIALAYSKTWPTTTLRSVNGVTVRFIAGHGSSEDDTPQTVKDAIMLYCDWRNENRTAESGELPRHFYDLLRPRRIPNA